MAIKSGIENTKILGYLNNMPFDLSGDAETREFVSAGAAAGLAAAFGAPVGMVTA